MKNLDDLKDRNYEHGREEFERVVYNWIEAGAKRIVIEQELQSILDLYQFND